MSKTVVKPETIGIPELSASLAEAHDLTKARAKAMLDGLRDEVAALARRLALVRAPGN